VPHDTAASVASFMMYDARVPRCAAGTTSFRESLVEGGSAATTESVNEGYPCPLA
jgi:hypothetical protein